MVYRKYCDICSSEIPEIPDDFCVEEMDQLGEYGRFTHENERGDILFDVDLCRVCTREVKTFILDKVKHSVLSLTQSIKKEIE